MPKLKRVKETPDKIARLFTLYPGIEHGWDLNQPDKVAPHHWFCSSVLGWNAHADIRECILERQKEDKVLRRDFIAARTGVLWLVPGPVDQTYSINEGCPQVEGKVFIAKFEYSIKKGRKS